MEIGTIAHHEHQAVSVCCYLLFTDTASVLQRGLQFPRGRRRSRLTCTKMIRSQAQPVNKAQEGNTHRVPLRHHLSTVDVKATFVFPKVQ